MHLLPLTILANVIINPVYPPAGNHMPVLDDEVAATRDRLKHACKGKAEFVLDFALHDDITGDSIPDLVIDYSKFTCDGATTECGNTGCRVAVFASDSRHGRKKVFDERVLNATFEKVNGRPAMLLELDSSVCDKPVYKTCRIVKFWNGRKLVPAR